MMTDCDIEEYIYGINEFNSKKPEVDLILMGMVFRLDLIVLYVEGESLSQERFSFGKRKVIIYINSDGKFDVAYDKKLIQNLGICQSIVLDVIPYLS